ncbi:MAG: transposase, partial [Pseudomonadota bacterium]
MQQPEPDARAQQWTQPGPPAPSPAVTLGKPHLGWRSRGYLPHCDEAGLFQHIVFGLDDGLPPGLKGRSPVEHDRALDRGHGACVLRAAECASILERVLLQGDSEQYRLIAWCIMPNHAHVIAQQIEGFPLGDIVQSWKSTSAHFINDHLSRRGRLWRREYFDRFMRDNDHLATTVA